MTHRSPIQHLEPRKLLADFATLRAGTLTLSGTSGNDSFTLLERSGKLRVIRSGVEIRFAANAVTKVIANLDAGDDSFVMNSALGVIAKIFGMDGNDTITAARGSDRIEGGAGDDVIDCGYGDDRAYGDTGIDILTYRSSSQRIRGTLQPFDRFTVPEMHSDGTVVRNGESDRHFDFESLLGTRFGDDLEFAPDQGIPEHVPIFEIDGGEGNDYLHTTTVGNPIQVTWISGRLSGGDGNDVINYGTGPRAVLTIEGGEGDDTLSSSTTFLPLDGITISGGDGIDTHVLGIAEGPSYDLPDDIENFMVSDFFSSEEPMIFRGNDLPNQISLISFGTAKASIAGAGGDDTIYGSRFGDTISGDAGDDLIYGGDGADRLYGGEGNDTLDGEAGRDFIYGGAGSDRGKKQSTDRVFDSIEGLV